MKPNLIQNQSPDLQVSLGIAVQKSKLWDTTGQNIYMLEQISLASIKQEFREI